MESAGYRVVHRVYGFPKLGVPFGGPILMMKNVIFWVHIGVPLIANSVWLLDRIWRPRYPLNPRLTPTSLNLSSQ